MKAEDTKPYGAALLDHFNEHEKKVAIRINRDDGSRGLVSVKNFFREPADFDSLDNEVINRSGGRVLDVGAGTGIHSLALQNRGLDVVAIDICPEAVEIMKKRGVRNALCADIFQHSGDQFDTILLLRTSAIVETLGNLDPLLAHLSGLLKAQGQLLWISADVRASDNFKQYMENNRKAGKYIGEIRSQDEYRGMKSQWFDHVLIDPETLDSRASLQGWKCSVLHVGQGGTYLASLRKV